MSLFTDTVQGGVERALDAVSLRQRVTGDNIANAMTPGYGAQRVDFEASLSAAMRSGRPGEAPMTVRGTGEAARLDGNNVEQEMAEEMRSGLQYQALVEAANHKLGLLKTAIQG